MGEFLRHADLTEEKFAEALSTAVAADDPGMDPLMAWLNKTEFSHFAATMKNKHLAMKQLGADEQVKCSALILYGSWNVYQRVQGLRLVFCTCIPVNLQR